MRTGLVCRLRFEPATRQLHPDHSPVKPGRPVIYWNCATPSDYKESSDTERLYVFCIEGTRWVGRRGWTTVRSERSARRSRAVCARPRRHATGDATARRAAAKRARSPSLAGARWGVPPTRARQFGHPLYQLGRPREPRAAAQTLTAPRDTNTRERQTKLDTESFFPKRTLSRAPKRWCGARMHALLPEKNSPSPRPRRTRCRPL